MSEKVFFPDWFMEAGNVVRARQVLEHFSSRGTYSEAYLANLLSDELHRNL
ncbi:MAG TPA: hypothetical protein PL112_23650 [Candidatus Obscuribacter sp.]|nr:hypothetical protein [Candidatus Obscuribacter sp.]